MIRKIPSTFFILILFSFSLYGQKAVVQGFWWDYWNSNYPNAWANYLADLAPRLKDAGVDAVWIPPTVKGSGTNNVGYAPFDNYDLGDKYQKGNLRSRVGNKDEVLRMIAVLHSNGIEVIQDVVLNHVTGASEKDPKAWGNDWKNFRYVCYKTNSDVPYLAREGRFPKNWPNFHKNEGHNCDSGDICADYWGPDICYEEGAYGRSSNAIFNPEQSPNYMRDGMRKWMIWYLKQCDFDGYRLDAVKHFPSFALRDFLWNVQNNAGWASGGEDMYAVGEYVDFNRDALDDFVSSIDNRAGTFDFSLRAGLKSMISGDGNFDMGSLPSTQQKSRVFRQNDKWVHRTVPFVNNHDTFRPIKNDKGNITGWDSSHELAEHIDSGDGRIAAAYAVALAMDGSPMIFFEDLFNIANTSKRYSHDPKDAEELPFRGSIRNLIWCHHNLEFKRAAYKVRYKSNDHLVIEREGKALVCATDSWNNWQTDWVRTGFKPGTKLKDYSGASGHTITVNNDGWVEVSTPPCNGTASKGRRGYAVWAPEGIKSKERGIIRTTQEWEMANDLGDSHPNSLMQGGALPANSKEWRIVGRINVRAGELIEYDAHIKSQTEGVAIEFYDEDTNCMVHLDESLAGDAEGSFTSDCSRWLRMRVRHTYDTSPEAKCWVKITYAAPKSDDDGYEKTCNTCNTLGTSNFNSKLIFTCNLISNPSSKDRISVDINNPYQSHLTFVLYDSTGKELMSETKEVPYGNSSLNLFLKNNLSAGLYILKVKGKDIHQKLIIE